jgi:hypothetical protein
MGAVAAANTLMLVAVVLRSDLPSVKGHSTPEKAISLKTKLDFFL